MRVQLADNQRFSTLKTVEESEAAFKKNNEQRYSEWRAEAKDVVKHIAGMKSRYTVRDSNTGDLITFYDDRPASRS
jgi:predicted transcriptional regulator